MAKKHSNQHSLDAVLKRKPIGTALIPKSLNPGPKTYAIRGDGDCLEPTIHHGDTLVCDPDAPPEPGDLIAIWWKDGSRQPLIKRLTLGLPDKNYWNATGSAEFLLVCEQLNPPRDYWIPLPRVQAVHKVIHHIPAM